MDMHVDARANYNVGMIYKVRASAFLPNMAVVLSQTRPVLGAKLDRNFQTSRSRNLPCLPCRSLRFVIRLELINAEACQQACISTRDPG